MPEGRSKPCPAQDPRQILRPFLATRLIACLWLGGPVTAQDLGDSVILQPQLLPDLDAMPRLKGNDPVAQRINEQLEGMDHEILEESEGCRNPPDSTWYRGVEIAFAVPRYLSIFTLNEIWCDGMLHPVSFFETPTFDLATGDQVDWSEIFPRGYIAKDAPHYDPSVITGSPLLFSLYFVLNGQMPTECREAIASDVDRFQVWLDAKEGGLVMSPLGLAHAIRSCGDRVILSPGVLEEIGAAPAVIEELRAASAPEP